LEEKAKLITSKNKKADPDNEINETTLKTVLEQHKNFKTMKMFIGQMVTDIGTHTRQLDKESGGKLPRDH